MRLRVRARRDVSGRRILSIRGKRVIRSRATGFVRTHGQPHTHTHAERKTWFTHAHAITMSSMSAHMTSRAATQKVMMTKGRKATNARATRAVTRAGRFEAERTYIMIKYV